MPAKTTTPATPAKHDTQGVIDMVNKALGSTTLMRGSDPSLKVSYLTTGLLPLDILMHGGLARGRFVEAYGDSSTLKSYVGLCAIRELQKAGGVAAIIDTEHAFDPDWAEEVGCDVAKIILIQPASGEAAMDAAEALIRSKVDLIVFDSIAASLPQQERDKRLDGENVQPARLAALMSVACRKLTTANSTTAIFWINQTRINVGITFGSNETTPGGKAMPFYASVRLNLKKVGKIVVDREVHTGQKFENTKVQVGQKYKGIIMKSKLSKPFEEVYFDWDMTKGSIDLTGFLISQLLEAGVITVKGSSWSYKDVKKVGREKFKAHVASDPDLLSDMEDTVRAIHDLPVLTRPKPVVKRQSKTLAELDAEPATTPTRRPRKAASKRPVRTAT